jgi:hypothetical protein
VVDWLLVLVRVVVAACYSEILLVGTHGDAVTHYERRLKLILGRVDCSLSIAVDFGARD